MAPQPHARGRLERASFVRHLAICLAAAAAWLLRDTLRSANEALWIICVTGAVNLLMTLVPDRPRWTRFSAALSPCVGLAGWAILVSLTGGIASLFVAGFWLEIVLSAWTFATRGTLLVTVGAAAALWTQALLSENGAPIRHLAFQTAFLAAMGGVTLLLTRQWARTQGESARRHAELEDRLRALEDEMETLRAVGAVGENVARLAHALKNAVHSLRGFASLIDARGTGPNGNAEAFEGLRAAIDRLEEIARITLGGRAAVENRGALLDGTTTRSIIDETIAEVSASYPRVAWRTRIDEVLPEIRADRATLREALLNLARNAAEAMNGAGEVAVETAVVGDRFEIRIRDRGTGFTEEDLHRTFRPGYTTKPGGSGFGLFLTRRLVEMHGGFVTVAPASGGGAVFSVGLPLRSERST